MVLKKAMSVIINNSTAVPFRWFSNKYMCFYCCLEFHDSSKLRDHNLKEHEDPTLRNALNNCNLTRIKIDIANIKCKKCLKPMTDLQDLVKHLSKNHEYNIDMKDLETIHCFKLSDETMSCLECAQNFTFFGNLLKHVHKCHNKQNPYLCEICGQGFIAKANVDSHIKYVHSRLKTPCVQCGETFPTPYALRAHREKVHRVNNLKCPMCPEIFGSRYLKRSHLAKVHDVKTVQFNCDECNKIFTQRSKLVSHKLTVHLKQRTITCEICGFKVFNQENLKRHIVRHNDDRPFECEYCKKRFQRKKTLQFHIRIHTNDRRYVCKECGKAFVQVTSLKSHVRNHLPAV